VIFNHLPTISTKKDFKEKEILEKLEDIEEDDENKTKNTMENEKVIAINGRRNYIFLYNSKGNLCCIADI
jgi:hypothetical protein